MDDERTDVEKEFYERQLVIFMSGNEEFGVDINDVREIIKLGAVTKIPNTEEYILGVINLRGKIIVVVDFAKKLGIMSKEKDKNARVIITEINGNTIGMIVDSCNEVLRITGDKIEPPPISITQKIDSDYIQGVGIMGERLLILLDLAKIFEKNESEIIRKVAEKQGNGAGNKEGTVKKILVADDSSMMRGTIKSYIGSKNYEIIEAKDGEETVMKAKDESPDIVLLDIKMPKLDGIEALKRIKEFKPETVVVMVTSVYEDETKKKCMELGASDYLKKPINKKQIESILK